MNTEKIEKLKKSLSNTLLPADLKPKIEAEIKRLEDLDAKQPTKRVAKKTSKAKPSRTTTPKRTAMSLAKEIRKEGESWSDARARASKMMKEKSHTATKDVETELNKLAEGGYLTDPTFGTFQNQVFADGGSISSKQLDLGYQYTFEKDRGNVGSLFKDGGVYSVMGFENGKHFSESFEKFADAKKFYLEKKGKVKFADGGGVDEWTHNLKYLTSKKVYFDITTGKVYPKMNLKPNMSKGKSIDEYDDKWFETLNDRDLATVQNYINNRKEFADGGGVGVETILFAVKKGEPDWNEVLITNNPAKIEDAKKWALANGFDRLRVSKIDMNEKPDFEKTFAKGGSLSEVYDVDINYKQIKGYLGRFPMTEKTAEKLSDTFYFMYFDLYDTTDKKPMSYNQVSKIITESMKEKGLYENGGGVEDVSVIYVDDYPYYIKKMGDSTHFRMANSKDGVDIVIPSHILQHRGESYYEDVRSWLKGGANPNGKKYISNDSYADGGKLPNNYKDKKPEEVWNMWSLTQKEHFLSDHLSKYKKSTPKNSDYKTLSRLSWNDVPFEIKKLVYEHINMGQYAKGGNINKNTTKMRKQKLKKGDTVTVIGRRWFDRVNGNTYHTAEVEVNGKSIGKSPMTYGYDDYYIETGKEILLQQYDFPRGMTERSPMWQLRDNGVTFSKYVSDGLKRDLAKGGGVRKVGNREYPLGRNWTNDHKHIDKSDDLEVNYKRKKKFELGGVMATDLAGHTGGAFGTGDPSLLSGNSGTAYTGLVGETGAMSSGEMFMNGGGLPSGVSQPYMITEALGNPAQHFAKGGGVRTKNGQTYNYGRVWTKDHNEFDKGSDHEVEYRRKKSSFFAKGGAMENIEYDDVLEVLKEKLEGAIDELPREYEFATDFKGEEVEKQSRDGFIAFTDGGYEVTWFESMSMFSGSGNGLPTKPLDDEMQRQIAYNYQLAKEQFIDDYPEIVEELGEDNIDYNSLYDAGYSDEAEQLSEWEMNYDGDDTIMCEIGAYYYDTENYRGVDEKHTIRLYGLVNLESPYHRRGNLDDSYDIDITFDSISELKEKVDAGLKEIIDWFDGKYYNDSDAEMKIRRMANGGSFAPNVSNGTEFMSGVYADGGFMDGVYAKGGKVSPFKNIMETNTITEKEINLIKMRLNNDKVDEATQEVIDYIWDNSPQLTPDQNKKGIDYLRNLWKSPTGKERTNNPFGYREQDALETFEYFELRGFYDAGNKYRKFYVPLYTCVGADSSFEYAFYNGEVNILG